jgi:hypothetical protein
MAIPALIGINIYADNVPRQPQPDIRLRIFMCESDEFIITDIMPFMTGNTLDQRGFRSLPSNRNYSCPSPRAVVSGTIPKRERSLTARGFTFAPASGIVVNDGPSSIRAGQVCQPWPASLIFRLPPVP